MSSFIICTSRPGKSIPNYFFAIAEQLKKEGNMVTLICDLRYNKEKRRNGVEILHWPNDRPTKMADAKFFYKLCRKKKPDTVIAQFGSKILAMAISKLLNIPNRVIYHHTLNQQLVIDLGRISPINSMIQKFIYSKISTKIIANSKATKQDVQSSYRLDPEKVKVLPLLLEEKKQVKIVVPQEERTNEILFVGRLDPSKGHMHIIEQIPSVLNIFPELKFVFIGKGSETKALLHLANELGIKESIDFKGYVAPDKVYDYMKRALVHISASKAEAFGLVNVEAIACGTPIIGPKTGGIADIVEENINGCFFDAEKEGDLAKKLKLVFNNWNDYSNGAKTVFEAKYSLKNPNNIKNQVKALSSYLD